MIKITEEVAEQVKQMILSIGKTQDHYDIHISIGDGGIKKLTPSKSIITEDKLGLFNKNILSLSDFP